MSEARQKRPRVKNEIQASIARSIASGEFPAGQNLPPEAELAERFGVSRTALREAIKGLEAKYMLRPRPRVGTLVLPQEEWALLDPEVLAWVSDYLDVAGFADAILEARRAIEPEAAALACRRASLADLAQVEAALNGMKAAGSNALAFTSADLAFHEALLRASHNLVLTRFIHSIEAGLNLMLLTSNKSVDDYSRTVESHRRLLDAMVARDEGAARAASLDLLDRAGADMHEARAKEGRREG